MSTGTTELPWMSYQEAKILAEQKKAFEDWFWGSFHCGYTDEELDQLQAGTHYTQTNHLGNAK